MFGSGLWDGVVVRALCCGVVSVGMSFALVAEGQAKTGHVPVRASGGKQGAGACDV